MVVAADEDDDRFDEHDDQRRNLKCKSPRDAGLPDFSW
jgi:hypothetical protein